MFRTVSREPAEDVTAMTQGWLRIESDVYDSNVPDGTGWLWNELARSERAQNGAPGFFAGEGDE